MDGVDDLGVIDPLEVDRGDAEVSVPQLALDDVQRHAFPRHLDGMRVTQLKWRKAPPHTDLGRGAAQLLTNAGSCQRSSAGAVVDDADQWPDGDLDAVGKPGPNSSQPH
ncbi:MAG: hypothetical protein QOD24_2789 [Solirubrobacteraceae bacterium]|nr:hypothetical protein [Solirubrobacteraceae bacterium]